MNKKFFAALASATMAFTASGSIAVFADDFVEEKTPVINNGEVTPKPTKVEWNQANFGDLATEDGKVNPNSGLTTIKVADGYVKTVDLEAVKTITLKAGFEGEIKGLEYFTGLTSFNDATVTSTKKVTNETLDFSANTALTSLTVNNAKGLTGIVLPKPSKTVDELDKYSLKTLDLQNTKLTSLDLSAQVELTSVTVSNNENLAEVTLVKGTSLDEVRLDTLDLSGNTLETVNLDYYYINENGTLNLKGNHIGALDLSKTTVVNKDNVTLELGDQKFYVSETLKNVNLAETFKNFDKEAVAEKKDVYSQKTGVLTLNGKSASYVYNTGLKGAKSDDMKVTLEAANPMNRLYNPNSGEHFYTADINEKEALVALGWNDEGYGWVAPVAPAKVEDGSDQPVYRLYNPNAGDHHYTTKVEERNTLVTFGWKDEGTGWYSAENKSHDKTVPVYRQYNPYANGAGSHNYTPDKAENNYLCSLGWVYEGEAWKALQ